MAANGRRPTSTMCCLTSEHVLFCFEQLKALLSQGLSIMNSNRMRFDHLARIVSDPDGTFTMSLRCL